MPALIWDIHCPRLGQIPYLDCRQPSNFRRTSFYGDNGHCRWVKQLRCQHGAQNFPVTGTNNI